MTSFAHSTPELYDRYMGPLLFKSYAELIAARSALLKPDRILETGDIVPDCVAGENFSVIEIERDLWLWRWRWRGIIRHVGVRLVGMAWGQR